MFHACAARFDMTENLEKFLVFEGKLRPCLIHRKTQKSFQDYSSHRILRHMHEALNIDESKN